MSIQDLINRIEMAKSNLQEARNQVPEGERRDVESTRHKYSGNLETYDRDRAVDYAKRHATSPNPLYIEFGNDCTNFATQVLIEGGVINYEDAKDPDGLSLFASETWNPNNWSWWWQEKRLLDTEFIRANELPQYLEENNLASMRTVEPTSREAVHSEVGQFLKPGDLIAYEHDDDPETDHVNVFIGYNENGVPMTANHTDNKISELSWEDVKTLIHIDDKESNI